MYKFLLMQASEDMHEPLVPMLFPSLGAHISGAEFQYPDRSWKETYGMMAQLVGNSDDNKGQLTELQQLFMKNNPPLFSNNQPLLANRGGGDDDGDGFDKD